jgi:hypothetical protein
MRAPTGGSPIAQNASELRSSAEKSARSMGFSPNVARRVAVLRPDVVKSAGATARPEQQRAYVAYRGMHNVTLAEFRHSVGNGAYIQVGGNSWASTYSTKGLQPRGHELHRGFVLELELPGHFFEHQTADDFKHAEAGTRTFVHALRAPQASELTPFIAKIGFTGANGVTRYYKYEQLFTSTRELTELAKKLDSQMVAKDPTK